MRLIHALDVVVGASSIIKQAKRGVSLPAWLTGLIARKPYKLVAVALANKNARIVWALLAKGGTYRKRIQSQFPSDAT